jgi:hypothetical protein
MCRQLIEDHFDATYRDIIMEFNYKFRTKKVDDRMLKNAAWVITPVKILMDHQKIDYTTTYNELLSVFYDNIEKQSAFMKDNTDIAKFWDIVEILYREYEIKEGKDFKFIDDCIALQLRPIHHYYSLTARKLGYEKILDRSTLENYLTNEPYFRELKTNNGRKRQVRFNGNPVPAMFFTYEDIGINLQGHIPNKNDEAEDEEKAKEAVTEKKAPVPKTGDLFKKEDKPVEA